MNKEVLSIEKAGAVARASGRYEFDNPYFRSGQMPAATGESLQDWSIKAEAWKRGWTIENAMKTGESP